MTSSVDEDYTNSTNGTAINVGATIYSPSILFLLGVLGNVLALLILNRTRRESQRLMFHGLVGGLVWNDLLGIVLTTPVTLASYANNLEMPGGEHLCQFNGFVMICFGLSTPLIVSAMAIERFLFVKYTFFYTRHCSPNNARLVILGIWSFVLLFGVLPLFGFGKYVLQYPQTWCFLDFKTTSSVDAAYGYIYAIINLLLASTMVVCNLTVVTTLSRVRDYRRKHSSSSLNMSLVMDEDSCKVTTQSRKRRQKDIELQMICVMFAITTIFAVCWVPLMIHIIYTLANAGASDGLLGLIAIRLASANQTINPWLYVILRRTLIVRVKRFCCRCKNEKRRKIVQSAHPGGRRHQYVHVGHRLCHRNNFVGNDGNSQSLSNSMRKSLQKAIPAAMSLPDVMMVNTGRRDLDMPIPDVAKAQSFGGRVSHGTWGYNQESRCCYCDCSSGTGSCFQCDRDRNRNQEKHSSVKDNDEDQPTPESHHVLLKSNDTVGFNPNSERINHGDDYHRHRHRHNSSGSADIGERVYTRADVTERLNSKPPSGRKDLAQLRDFQSSIKNSSSSRERHRTDSQRSNEFDIFSTIFTPSNRSSFHSQTGNPVLRGAMSQCIHLQKRDTPSNPVQSLSSSIKSHGDDPNKPTATPLSDSIPSDREYKEDIAETGTTNSKIDITTDCGVFSSNPTESVCFSDSIYVQFPTDPKKPFSHPKGQECCIESSNGVGKHARTRSKSYTKDGCEDTSVNWSPDAVCVEEERSSGVFSVESPTKLKNENDISAALWETKNEAGSNQSSNSKSHLKPMVRRIKSAT